MRKIKTGRSKRTGREDDRAWIAAEMQGLRRLLQAPECIEPWFDRFYGKEDIRLLLHLINEPKKSRDVCSDLGLQPVELHRAWQRGVVAWDEEDQVSPADFHTRFDYWAMFEGWKDIPGDIRAWVNRWELGHYIETHAQDLETVRLGTSPSPERIIPRYLLLEESLEVIDRVDRIFLWPCNCRSMLGNCSKPVFTCLRFSNDRGIGWEISRDKAKEIIQEANRAGLMQSGELGTTAEGKLTGAICNCCADCCFPHLMGKEFEAEKIWPQSRYLVRQHQDLCTGCGRCLRRCPFQALTGPSGGSGKGKGSPPVLNPDLCRGCGLCATGCPEQALTMHSLYESVP